ncbi:MAG: acylglycerol kinase family protein [Bradymonadaceae bacterium]|nr:acylglycerol kinase family protein [Lujinxingiaceae bacterium]
MVDGIAQTLASDESRPAGVDPQRIHVIPAPRRYAVLLNARAKAWTGEIHQAVQRFVPAADLFLTDDFRQAQQTVEKILGAGYDAVFTGGGDGTVVYLINALEKRIQSGKLRREDAPPIGVLRLGTGNAIATYVGAGPIIEDLRTLHAGSPLKVHQVSLVGDGEHRFPFAGFGWDADILNDYDYVKNQVRDTAWENYVTGLGGYAVSLASRTIPKAARRSGSQIVITNLGEVGYRLDEHGQIVREFAPGEVAYDGPSKICSSATIPFWGFKIRMFPYANLRPGFFELRTYKGNISSLLASLPSFWKGDVKPEQLSDFLFTKARVDVLHRPTSYQVAGDAAGLRDSVTWSIAEHPAYLAVPLQ